MENPKITVVTVCFNAVDSIEETMLSVLNQTYESIEYIIIDGGSRDGTVDIIKKYSDRLAYWVSEPDKGIYDAMNKGIEVATGDYINFMNAGDSFTNPNVICNVIEGLSDKNACIYGQVEFIPSHRIYNGEFNKYKLTYRNIPHQAIFYCKSAILKYKYNIKYKLFADYVLNIEIYGDKSYSFIYSDVVVAYYEQGGISSNINNDNCFLQDKNQIIKKYLGYKCYLYSILREQIRRLIRKFFPA